MTRRPQPALQQCHLISRQVFQYGKWENIIVVIMIFIKLFWKIPFVVPTLWQCQLVLTCITCTKTLSHRFRFASCHTVDTTVITRWTAGAVGGAPVLCHFSGRLQKYTYATFLVLVWIITFVAVMKTYSCEYILQLVTQSVTGCEIFNSTKD